MNRNSGNRAGQQRSDGRTSSEALSFAAAIFGESPAPRALDEADDGIDWERFEFLASISSDHERKLRDLARAGKTDSRKREQLQWLAEISTEHGRQFQDLLREEAAAAGVRDRARRCLENIERLREIWDEDKHPRLGGPPNAGWFASTGGSSATASPKPRAPKPDALVRPTRQHDSLAQAQPPEYGGQQGATPGDNRLAQNPPPVPGGRKQEKTEYVQVKGTEVVAGGGYIADTDIDVTVYKDVTFAAKVDGKFLLDANGNEQTKLALVQFDADSNQAGNLHWVQFFKASEYGPTFQPVVGGSVTDRKTTYHGNGEWYIDMPLPPRDGKPDPDAIYYDHPATGNVFTRTKTNVSIFDNPREGTTTPGAVVKKVEFKTYLVGPAGPLWEISWVLETTVDKVQGKEATATGRITSIQGRPVKGFAAELNTRQWNIGNRMEPLNDGTTNARPSTKPEQVANPFAKK